MFNLIDKLSYKILKYLKDNDKVPIEIVEKQFKDNISDSLIFLEKDRYIIRDTIGSFPTANGFVSSKDNKYRISPKGRAYIQEHKIERIKYWVPIILADLLSIAAIIVSILK